MKVGSPYVISVGRFMKREPLCQAWKVGFDELQEFICRRGVREEARLRPYLGHNNPYSHGLALSQQIVEVIEREKYRILPARSKSWA